MGLLEKNFMYDVTIIYWNKKFWQKKLYFLLKTLKYEAKKPQKPT